jgi:hypothetical protein
MQFGNSHIAVSLYFLFFFSKVAHLHGIAITFSSFVFFPVSVLVREKSDRKVAEEDIKGEGRGLTFASAGRFFFLE